MAELSYVVSGQEIKIGLCAHVMPPTVYSQSIANCISKINTKNKDVLDMGCGTGFLSIALAKHGARKVYASDINPESIKTTRQNIAKNGVQSKVMPILSDLFSGLRGKKFDLIVSNPPFLPLPENRKTNPAADWRDFIDDFIYSAPWFLKKGGEIVFTNSSLANIKKTKQLLKRKFGDYVVLRRQRILFRECTLRHFKSIKKFADSKKAAYFKRKGKYYETLHVLSATMHY